MGDKDDRSWFTHKVHQWGHEYNASRKKNGKPGIEELGLYKSYSPEKASNGPWSINVDYKRAKYHKKKAEESDCLIF